MKHSYIIETTGNIIQKKTARYIVRAKSPEDARELAHRRFQSQFETVSGEMIYGIEQQKKAGLLASMVCMAIAVFLTLIPLRWANGHLIWETGRNIRLYGNSLVYALLFYAAYFVKNKEPRSALSSVQGVLSTLLVVLIFTGFIRILIDPKAAGVFQKLAVFVGFGRKRLLLIALLLAWISVDVISCLMLLLLAFLPLGNTSYIMSSMGWIGMLYLLSAYLGLALCLASDPYIPQVFSDIAALLRKGSRFAKNSLTPDRHIVTVHTDAEEADKTKPEAPVEESTSTDALPAAELPRLEASPAQPDSSEES